MKLYVNVIFIDVYILDFIIIIIFLYEVENIMIIMEFEMYILMEIIFVCNFICVLV